MRLALVDDNVSHMEALREMLADALSELGFSADSVACHSSPDAFFSDFSRENYDIIILDIYMGEVNGIDVARHIRSLDSDVAIAFCTSSNEFASQSYEVDARFYLQKPISREKVLNMLKRFNLSKIERNRAISLPDGLSCPLRHIKYTEYRNHRVFFYINDGSARSFYLTQKDAENMLLPFKGFSSVNKGNIVNFAHVSRLSGGIFSMSGGEQIPVSRRRLKDVESEYMQYRFDKMDEEVSD